MIELFLIHKVFDSDHIPLAILISKFTDKKYQTTIVTDIKVTINSLSVFGFRYLVGVGELCYK